MYTFARFYVLKLLSQILYCIGDISCRVPTSLTANIYQLTMRKSFELDEKIGFEIWKK